MLRWQRCTIQLIREQSASVDEIRHCKASFVRLLDPTVDSPVGAREQHLDRSVGHSYPFEHRAQLHTSPLTRPDCFEQPGLARRARLQERPTIARTFHGYGASSGWERPQIVDCELSGAVDQTADAQAPTTRIDHWDVEVNQQVMQTDGCHRISQRLQRHAVIARRQLQFLERNAHARREVSHRTTIRRRVPDRGLTVSESNPS